MILIPALGMNKTLCYYRGFFIFKNHRLEVTNID